MTKEIHNKHANGCNSNSGSANTISPIAIGNRYKPALKGESSSTTCNHCEANNKTDVIANIVINAAIVPAENDLFLKSLTSNIGSELDKLRLTNITIMVIANTITTHGIISASPSFENSLILHTSPIMPAIDKIVEGISHE